MGSVKFAPNQSLYQTAYVGILQPDGMFKILWQSKNPLFPEPYDALAFPGKHCVLK
jgi:urea transport system substrate-binding protein